MGNADVTRRDFLMGTAAACGSLLIGEFLTGMPTAAHAAAGQPIPPIKLTYYSNWQEIVEFFKKAAEDLRKVGLTPEPQPGGLLDRRPQDLRRTRKVLRRRQQHRLGRDPR